jgi:peptide/nickel transport system permease protein
MAEPARSLPAAGAARRRARSESYSARAWRQYRRSRAGLFGLAMVVLLGLVGLLAPVLANDQPLVARYDGGLYFPAVKELVWTIPGGKRLLPKKKPFSLVTFDFEKRAKAERGDWAIYPLVPHGPLSTSSRTLESPSGDHWLGTDGVGRDVLARMIHGARVSMAVGFLSVGISTVIGLLIGALAGFFRGPVDFVLSRIIEVVICFPVFFLILSILAWRPPSIWNVMIVIGVTRWTGIARYVRGEFIRLSSVDYSVAATALGAGPGRIIFRHVMPNALAPVFVPVTFGIASAILVEAGLSLLGFGVQPPNPSWGNILRAGFDNIFTTAHMIYPPCVAIFVAVLAYNLVGDTLRDAIDPRLGRSG